ncbi:MAG: MATE family efflux transporter [Chitinispirillales bacterium]|jgi:putative MATE family efflux protein|nr:MATE family efflux transporter [Chitinispirillales bacterium]
MDENANTNVNADATPKPKRFGKDLTEGSVPRHLISLAVPMLLANLLGTSYSLVDAIWIGRYVGKEAIGAVAVSFPVMFIFIGVAAGATIATTVLVSQFYGARNQAMLSKTIGTSFCLTIILGVVSAVGGILAAEKILAVLGTPDTVVPLAESYLKIMLLSLPVMFMHFLISSVLRGVGDTKTPLYFMLVGVTLNAILDPLMIIGIGPFPKMGLDGAAWASLICPIIGLVLLVGYLRRKGGALTTGVNFFSIDAGIAKLIAKIGFPSIIQQTSISFGIAAVTSIVNSFGAAAIAAFGVGGRIDAVAFLPAQSIGLAVSTISGQNIGAGRYDRIPLIFKWGIIMTSCITVSFAVIFLSIPEILMAPFMSEPDPEVIEIGRSYLRIAAPAISFFAVMFVSNGVINGAGHTFTTLIFTLIAVWGIRIPFATLLSRTSLGIKGVWVSYVIGFSFTMCISLLWYRSGRWKKAVVKHKVPDAVP